MTAFEYRISNDIPAFYLNDDDTAMMLSIFQHWISVMHADVSSILCAIDVDMSEEKYLDLMLYETGWDLKIPLSIPLKRKIVKLADYIYLNKGIESKITEVVKLLTGVDILLETSSQNAFTLDDSKLDSDNVFLWGEGYLYEFLVQTPAITPEMRFIIEKLIDYMKYAVSYYKIYEVA